MCQNAVLEVLSPKDASRNDVTETCFHGIDITGLGMSWYPAALLFGTN
jgi:hypothetical protein